MKKAINVLMFFAAFVTSCGEDKKIAVPADLIPQEKFTQVLIDIRLLEGAYSTHYARIDSSNTKIEAYYLSLFDKHGISKENYMSSYQFYALDQNRMLQIEEKVVERLTEMNGAGQDTTKTTVPGV